MGDTTPEDTDKQSSAADVNETKTQLAKKTLRNAFLTSGGLAVLVAIAALMQSLLSDREQSASMSRLLELQGTSVAIQSAIANYQVTIAAAVADGKDQQEIAGLQATVDVLVAERAAVRAQEQVLRATTNPGATALPTLTPLPTFPPAATQPPTPTPTPQPTATDRPTLTPIPSTPSPTVCAAQNPYNLRPDQLVRMGCEDGGFVHSRGVVTQRFDNGFMIIFDDPSNSDFTRPNQRRRIYAVADDGRVWRVFFDPETVIQNTSPNPDDWYTCEKRPGQRPSQSRIPWRGFGMAWCMYPDIGKALGYVRAGAEEIKERTSFQSYEHGRAFALGGQVYATYFDPSLNLATTKYAAGRWD